MPFEVHVDGFHEVKCYNLRLTIVTGISLNDPTISFSDDQYQFCYKIHTCVLMTY